MLTQYSTPAETVCSIKSAFDELYRCMHSMPLREMEKIVGSVCSLP